MNTHDTSGKGYTVRVVRPRSLMVAGALTMSGVIIAHMIHLYLDNSAIDGGVTRSRLWWEIVLNLQILSSGVVWFAYADIISNAEGKRRRSYIFQCVFVIMSVLLPTLLGAVAAWNNWFEIRPDTEVYWAFIGLGLLHWFIGIFMQWHHSRRYKKEKRSNAKRIKAVEFLPVLVLVLIAVIDAPAGGTHWLVAMPVLLYMHGAVLFVLDGFGWR